MTPCRATCLDPFVSAGGILGVYRHKEGRRHPNVADAAASPLLLILEAGPMVSEVKSAT